MNKKIYEYQTIDSTNIQAMRLAKEGAEHGIVVTALEQTAGRGRRGRTWDSPKGENLYMSLLLRPQMEAGKAPMLTLVMAYSVAKMLEEIGFPEVKIKWPNDLVLNGKKVCGILTEMAMNGQEIGHVVIGVGINVNTKSFPEELAQTATSLYLQKGEQKDIKEILKKVMDVFEEDYEAFVKTGDLSFMQEAYNQFLINCGREVRVLEPENEYTAQAVGIDANGELTVVTEDGYEKKIFAGEVSVRGVYGYV